MGTIKRSGKRRRNIVNALYAEEKNLGSRSKLDCREEEERKYREN